MSPQAARRNCAEPGCPNLVTSGRCPAHRIPRKPDSRLSYADRPGGPGRYWSANRARFLTAHPFCEHCGMAATDVDHRVARVRGGSDAWPNLQALCHSCHSRKTAQSDGAFGNRVGGITSLAPWPNPSVFPTVTRSHLKYKKVS
jgi:5-methylcytosine-specific restriction enzyme A